MQGSMSNVNFSAKVAGALTDDVGKTIREFENLTQEHAQRRSVNVIRRKQLQRFCPQFAALTICFSGHRNRNDPATEFMKCE